MAANVSSYRSDTSSNSKQPNYTGTTTPTNQFNGSHCPEKIGYHNTAPITTENEKGGTAIDEEEDEDMDALIDDLESEDDALNDEVDEKTEAGVARLIPEELLQTSTTQGLTNAEVLTRRRKFGPNQMKEEKQNLILNFLGFFVGPIQFVMEVRSTPSLSCLESSGLSSVYETCPFTTNIQVKECVLTQR